MSLLNASLVWLSLRADQVQSGDRLIRRGGRVGQSVQSVRLLPDGWLYINYAHGRGMSPAMRRDTVMCVERLVDADAA